MKEKGFTPILIILLIATVIGGYLVYSGKINSNKSQPTPSSSSVTIKNETTDFAEGSPEFVSNNFYQWYLRCLNDHFKKASNGEGSNKTPD